MSCKKPVRIIIPETVKNIGDYAFFECTGLREVVTPGSVDRIGNAAFAECSMTAVRILDGVKSIDNLAFQNCLHLRDVLVPDSVTEVGFKVFAGCEMLKSVRIKNYKSKEGYLPDCSMLERLDNGKFQWPRNETEALQLTPQQTRWLMEGLKIEQPKAIREGKKGALY